MSILFRSKIVFLLFLLAITACLFLCPAAVAQEYQIPILDTLEKKQKIQAQVEAPNGEDEVASDLLESLDSELLTSKKEEPSALEESVSENLNEISLEDKIQSQVVQKQLEQFGYEVFNKVSVESSSFPRMPVPQNYVVGPSDLIIVQLYGKTNLEYKLKVTREGNILIPDIGPIFVAGLSFRAVKERINDEIAKAISSVRTAITLGELRTIQVTVLGEVNSPGSYYISSVSNLLETLIKSGGVKRTGSLRKIQLRRDETKEVITVDMYDAFMSGNTSLNLPLRANDTVFVPTIGSTVGIAGEVTRPAIYELSGEKTVADVLKLAGGLLPTASATNCHIERVHRRQSRTLIDIDLESSRGLQSLIHAGDILRIFPIASVMDEVVLLTGNVRRPGGYQWRDGIRVSDLISSPSDLLLGTDMRYALIRSEDVSAKHFKVRSFDLADAIKYANTKKDPMLSARDELIVFKMSSTRSEVIADIVRELRARTEYNHEDLTVELRGNLRSPGKYPYEPNLKIMDYLTRVSGGLLSESSIEYVLVFRERFPAKTLEAIPLDLSKAMYNPAARENTQLLPGDKVVVFKSSSNRPKVIAEELRRIKSETPYGQLSPLVHVGGAVRFPGSYPHQPGMLVGDLITAGGGLKENSFGITAEITRYTVTDDEFRETKHLPVNLASTSGEGINAESQLEPYDRLNIHPKPMWNKEVTVELEGEVLHPGTYTVRAGEKLSDVVKRAGGVSKDGYVFGAVFLRKAVQEQQQASLDQVQEKLDDLLVNLHLSPSAKNSEKFLAGGQKHQLFNVIKQLKQTKAVGRMVIDLDAVLAGKKGADLVLQDGDRLIIPVRPNQVSVMGEVYVQTSHFYRKKLKSNEYVKLSGGPTTLANKDHVYVVQANGEVVTGRKGLFGIGGPRSVKVTPGSVVFVPLALDRMNGLEEAQSWVQIAYQMGLSAASLTVLGVF